ncbi:putative ribonuclease H protein, partial [Trifolium medium]|nr:putative ribonuclease H protein [Trifolium medium]
MLAPWSELLRFRYGSFAANFLYGEGIEGLKKASIWWRDIWSVGGASEANWFSNNVSNIIGDGKVVGFWKEKWIGSEPLRAAFPTLYVKSSQQDDCIADMGKWENDSWSWNLSWTATLSVEETAAAGELLLILEEIKPCMDVVDRRKWIPQAAGSFSVQSSYTVMQNLFVMDDIDINTERELKKLWLNDVPSKVSIFGWRLLLEKLPTQEALYRKGIITNRHDRWMGINFIQFEAGWHHFNLFGKIAK